MGRIDAKAFAGTIGGAIAYIQWVLLAAFVPQIRDIEPEVLVGLATANATIYTGILSYWVPNAASPLPGDGVGGDPEGV